MNAQRERIFHVFVNDEAGSVVAGDGGGQHADIVAAFAAHGVSAIVEAVAPDRLGERMRAVWSSAAGSDRPDAVIVAGGDGTVNAAAGVAAAAGIVLGVLPLGTFNHFAKDVGIPTTLPEAAAHLADAVATAIDVGEVNGSVFVNNASIGVYPAMVDERDQLRERRRWGKVRAVPVAVIRTLRTPPSHRLTLHVDGRPAVRARTSFVFIGNGLFDDDGRSLGSRSSLTDGVLGVYVITTVAPWLLVRNAVTARIRGVEAAPHTERLQTTELRITGDEGTIAIAVDGEVTSMTLPLDIRVRPGALTVLAATTNPSS